MAAGTAAAAGTEQHPASDRGDARRDASQGGSTAPVGAVAAPIPGVLLLLLLDAGAQATAAAPHPLPTDGVGSAAVAAEAAAIMSGAVVDAAAAVGSQPADDAAAAASELGPRADSKRAAAVPVAAVQVVLVGFAGAPVADHKPTVLVPELAGYEPPPLVPAAAVAVAASWAAAQGAENQPWTGSSRRVGRRPLQPLRL